PVGAVEAADGPVGAVEAALLQFALSTAIVLNVSPNCEKTAEANANSASESEHAMILANVLMAVVISKGDI
ncbi:MAG: hypothetical protein LIO58_02025, partial [Oscillospiraceae bacterium]|nr:hypothetical protein [Oscillospiraceae bacterium]